MRCLNSSLTLNIRCLNLITTKLINVELLRSERKCRRYKRKLISNPNLQSIWFIFQETTENKTAAKIFIVNIASGVKQLIYISGKDVLSGLEIKFLRNFFLLTETSIFIFNTELLNLFFFQTKFQFFDIFRADLEKFLEGVPIQKRTITTLYHQISKVVMSLKHTHKLV